MASIGPWRRVGIAIMVLAILAALAFIAFREGGYVAALRSLETFFQQQGMSPEESQNVSAGVLQSALDVLFLTGVLSMIGYVQQGFRRRTETRLAAQTIFGAYKDFVSLLVALRATQEKQGTQPLEIEQVSSRIVRLETAMANLRSMPLHFIAVMPEAANVAITEAIGQLGPFHAFTQAVRQPASSAASSRVRTVYIGSAAVAKSRATITELHATMRTFFRALGVDGAIRRQMDGKLSEQMAACAEVANTFITIAPETAALATLASTPPA